MTAGSEIWSAPRDFRLRLMRVEGMAWAAIAEALLVAPELAIARAKKIGADRPPPGPAAVADPAREPLPAGHPQAWGVLTEGTWLDGTRYPISASVGDMA